LKAILIDKDERALVRLEKLIKSTSNIQVVGKFTDPFKARSFVVNEGIDMVFLETQLPGLNGIVLAKYLKDLNEDIEIVFTTNVKEYAIDAFNIDALDYIIKPVKKTRLRKTLERILERKSLFFK